MIRAILAHDAYWGIGKDGDLPWNSNHGDLQWFKQCTVNSVVVMGRKTWDSLPRRPLPSRENIVVTHDEAPGADIVGDLQTIEKMLPRINHDKNVWIIGGASIVEQLLPVIDELWLNDVGDDYDCDTFLPKAAITKQFEAGSVEIKPFGVITKWVRKQ